LAGIFAVGGRIVDVGPSDLIVKRHAGAATVIDGLGKVVTRDL
jgi:imidazolonepropionase-like amidohydrolase